MSSSAGSHYRLAKQIHSKTICFSSMTIRRMSTNQKSLKGVLLVIFIILFAGMVRLPSLTQPLGPDQGIMSVIGEGILQGQIPYKDFWEMGTPAVFFTYALIFKIFGTHMAAIPAADMAVSMLTTLLIFLVAQSVWNQNIGYASALLFAFFSNGVRLGMHAGGDIAFGTFWYIAQRETFMLALITGSFYFLLRSEHSKHRQLWLTMAGILSGLAAVYKLPALAIFLCLPLYLNICFFNTESSLRFTELLRRNLALFGGFALALLPFVAFFWSRNALKEMLDVTFGYVYSVYGSNDGDMLALIKAGLIRTRFIAEENFILWIFFIVSSLQILTSEKKKEKYLIVGWGITSFVFLISHREFFGYHYLVLLPPFCILGGYGLTRCLGPMLEWRRIVTGELEKAFVLLALIANLAFFTTLNYLHYTKFYYYLTGKISQETYYSYFTAYPEHDYSFPADYAVANYLAENTAINDYIFTIGGTDAVIQFLSKRKSASRFIFSWILFSGQHSGVEKAERYRQELLEDLRKRQPRCIVSIGPLENIRQFAAIYQFVSQHYFLEKEFPDGRYVYGRHGSQG